MISPAERLSGGSIDRRPAAAIIDVAPGAISVICGSGRLRTIVGSGVTVCLYDRCTRVAGMNHFLHPRTDDLTKATGRYGNAALTGLLRLVGEYGPVGAPVAYVAGGAYCDEFEMDSALENVRIAWKFLLVKGIPIVSQHIGGQCPREVQFDVASGVYTARPQRTQGLARREFCSARFHPPAPDMGLGQSGVTNG